MQIKIAGLISLKIKAKVFKKKFIKMGLEKLKPLILLSLLRERISSLLHSKICLLCERVISKQYGDLEHM